MLKWKNKQWVESDEGFSFLFTGRYTAEYIEGDRKLSLFIEDGMSNDNYGIIIKSGSLNKWDNNQKILLNEKDVILRNISEALEFQNINLIIEN
ncbi:MAG: hypothetical protein KBH06_01435 [Spirochaetes bacterium]|nr:hypothetical protein [Spirochaetota bacterium]